MYKYKCIRVDNSQGIKRYYCIDQSNNAVVMSRNDMLRLIQYGQVSNVTAFIRNGVACIRVNGAIKENTRTPAKMEVSGIKSKVISQIIKKMQSGVVDLNMDTPKFLAQLGLSEFSGSKELISMDPSELVKLAGGQCADIGKHVYLFGINDSAGYKMLMATTNKRRVKETVQQFVVKETLHVLNSPDNSAEDAAKVADRLYSRVFITTVA